MPSARGPSATRIVAVDAPARYSQGTTVGSGRDIVGLSRERVGQMITEGRQIVSAAKARKLLPDGHLTGATAALLITLAGYGQPVSEGQWREMAGVVAGLMQKPDYPDLSKLRGLISPPVMAGVIHNSGFAGFIRRQEDGRWVCGIARGDQPPGDRVT